MKMWKIEKRSRYLSEQELESGGRLHAAAMPLLLTWGCDGNEKL
jgi:hypothetical protein